MTVVDQGIAVPRRAIWIVIQFADVRLGILNVYAPNQSGGRAVFWDTLATSLPTVEHWCVGDLISYGQIRG